MGLMPLSHPFICPGEEILNKSAESMAKISVLYQAGMVRLHPEIYDTDPAMTGDILSDEEKAAYRAVVMKSFMTKNMVDEARYAYANAAKVDSWKSRFKFRYFIIYPTVLRL